MELSWPFRTWAPTKKLASRAASSAEQLLSTYIETVTLLSLGAWRDRQLGNVQQAEEY